MIKGRVPTLAPHRRLRWEPVRGTHIVVGPETAAVLNATAAAVVACCDGARDLEAVAAAVGRRYEDVVAEDIAGVVDALTARRVLEWR
ncbi:MAG: pyrroloquinoline quinone biosynthesis peptide chaperone PqqD [Acidimicrobiales bacterium]